MMKKLIHILALCMMLCTPLALSADGKVYNFKRNSQTLRLSPYLTTLYSAGPHEVNNMLGAKMHSAGKDTIISLQVLPTGIGYLVVEKGKKSTKAEVYSVLEEEAKTGSFNARKFGSPVSAVYTHDGRTLILATDRGILLVDPKTMMPTGTIAGSDNIRPTEMAVSPNLYYLACADGNRVTVYNLEEREERTTLDLGETVTAIAFSPDNSDLAVLTSDGVLSIFSTRTFDLRKMADGLGQGIDFGYNLDGKYAAVATAPDQIVLVNLLNDADREEYDLEDTGLTSVCFLPDASKNTVMAYGLANSVQARRMEHLKPFFNKLISGEADKKMEEWMKMMPGETMDQYRTRMDNDSRAKRRAMFEFEIATELAGNILAGKQLSIGSYDRANSVLALEFESMPAIFIPVPENEVTDFRNPADLSVTDVLYGVNPDDSFDLVYARVTNKVNNKEYVFDNRERAELAFMESDNVISIEALQQQQMEEQRLHELREQVVREAKIQNVISDHTNISVSSRLVPDFDANGNKILNYEVSFTYEVDPEFSSAEDFGPGKYHAEESGAAMSMLKIVKEAMEGDLSQYLDNSRRLRVSLTGSADATPILRGIPYDGVYGTWTDEPTYINGDLSAITVEPSSPIKDNEKLAFVRALGVRDFLEHRINNIGKVERDYTYAVSVSEGKGSEYRRINLVITFIDSFN